MNIFELLFFLVNVFIGFVISITLTKLLGFPKWTFIPLGIAIAVLWIMMVARFMRKREEIYEEKWVLRWMNTNQLSNDDLMDRIKIVQSTKANTALENELARRIGKSA